MAWVTVILSEDNKVHAASMRARLTHCETFCPVSALTVRDIKRGGTPAFLASF